MRYMGNSYNRKKIFIITLIIFCGWMPYFICNYPGSVCNDARDQLAQILKQQHYSNHNPIVDTVIYGIFFKLGRIIGGSDNSGIASIVLLQFFLLAMSFGISGYIGYKFTKSRLFVIFTVMFYVFTPLFGGGAQCVLKDTLHTSFFVMWACCSLMLTERMTDSKLAVFCILSAVVAYTRSMANAYVFPALIAWGYKIVKYDSKRRRIIMVLLTVILTLAFEPFINVFFEVEKYPSREKYALPLQQIGYVVSNNELSDEEYKMVSEVIPVDVIKQEYNPNLADPLKNCISDESQKRIPKIYFFLLKKYPLDMITAVAVSYYKYFIPGTSGNGSYRAYIADCDALGLSIYYVNKNGKAVIDKYVGFWLGNNFLRFFMGPGIYSCVFIFSFVVCKSKWIEFYIPLFVLCAGLLFTPVNGEIRYAFPIIALSPVMIALYIKSLRRE